MQRLLSGGRYEVLAPRKVQRIIRLQQRWESKLDDNKLLIVTRIHRGDMEAEARLVDLDRATLLPALITYRDLGLYWRPAATVAPRPVRLRQRLVEAAALILGIEGRVGLSRG